MKRSFHIPLCLFLIFVVSATLQASPAQVSQSTTTPSAEYPDSIKGLQNYLENLFAAINSKDQSKIDSLWRGAVLPDHDAWFNKEFGDQEGPGLDSAYTRQLANTVSGPGKAYMYVAGLDTWKFVIFPMAQAAVSRPNTWAKLIDLSLKVPVSVYRAEAIGPGNVTSYMLGYYFYVDGGFRLVDESVFGALSSAKSPASRPYISSLEAQMLLLQSTSPVAPQLVNKEGISNTVMLEVVIDVLGQVQSATILSGDLVLGNAARAAVLGWRYRPYIQNGRAVEVETTVTVMFPL